MIIKVSSKKISETKFKVVIKDQITSIWINLKNHLTEKTFQIERDCYEERISLTVSDFISK